ncbi:MAG TPA: PEGA domain-containing protein [Kofleriaceae bacterium]|nr:PEGA domain-containing protein [Kofleriaceae bacterium]
MRIAALVLVLGELVAHADHTIAVAPLSTLGAEDKSAATKKMLGDIERAIAGLPGNKVVAAAQVAQAIDRAKKPQLKACEGDAACLAELGKLVGADVVVTGEVGGLGDSRVIYLGATDVASGKELRSTTYTLGATDDGGGASGAAIRLLEPDHYRGTLRFAIDVPGATVFVNGAKVTPSPKGELALPVGTQAVRITQPEYHDFIKFIDVPYGKTIDVPVRMQEYPIVEHDVKAKPTSRDHIVYILPPLWRRPYVAGPAIVVLAIVVGVIAYEVMPQHVGSPTECRPIGGTGNCN